MFQSGEVWQVLWSCDPLTHQEPWSNPHNNNGGSYVFFSVLQLAFSAVSCFSFFTVLWGFFSGFLNFCYRFSSISMLCIVAWLTAPPTGLTYVLHGQESYSAALFKRCFFALEPCERSVSGGYFSRIAAKPFLGSGILCRLLFIVEPIVSSVPFCSQVYSPRLHPWFWIRHSGKGSHSHRWHHQHRIGACVLLWQFQTSYRQRLWFFSFHFE